MNEERFLGLLKNLIGVVETLQDNPPDLIPREDNASDFVLAALEPYTVRGATLFENVCHIPVAACRGVLGGWLGDGGGARGAERTGETHPAQLRCVHTVRRC